MAITRWSSMATKSSIPIPLSLTLSFTPSPPIPWANKWSADWRIFKPWETSLRRCFRQRRYPSCSAVAGCRRLNPMSSKSKSCSLSPSSIVCSWTRAYVARSSTISSYVKIWIVWRRTSEILRSYSVLNRYRTSILLQVRCSLSSTQ